jgi:diguanylate cyclase (GGDEF)-like protein
MYEVQETSNGSMQHWVVEEQTLEVRERPRLFGRLAWYRRRVESLEQQTVVDELTGLRNQRALWRELDRRASACTASHPLAVVMLDFDLFKELNDSYGRSVGDAVLRRAASVVRSAAASPRLAFRCGGEEFVLLADADADDARGLAEQVRAEIAGQNGALPAVTVSCGVVELESPVEPWVAIDRADAALRDAKRSGRNRVVVAGHTSPGERMLLVEELEHETARRAAMALAVATLEVRDRGTADHSDDVLTLCDALGRRLDLDDGARQHLRAGAQLHDVGKVAVPSSILNKQGALTEAEWAVIHEHTIIGERILRSVPEMAEVATIVRHSHEHWDGSGYPDGLAGDEIPLASRVILCADAFHAMRSDRPYRRGRPACAAVTELRACAGTQFDPAVVDAFVEVSEDARNGRTAGAVELRRKRLVVLLTTLAIGGGSAVAGIPELRDAIKSVFGAITAPNDVAHGVGVGVGESDFSFGPLGHVLRLTPAAHRVDHKRSSSSSTTGGEPRRHRSAGGPRRAASVPSGEGQGQSGGGGELHGTGAPGPTGTSPGDGTAPPSSGDTQAPTGGEDGDAGEQKVKPSGNGHGRAVGHGLPTPRRSAQSPPFKGGRTDPPALGHTIQSNGNGQAKGHSK